MIGPHHSIISLLDRRRAGRRGVDRDLQRRQVVALAHLLRQLQHAREHRRHQLAVRDAPFLDQREIMLGVELLHDDGGAADADGEIDGGLRRRMIERRRRQIDHALAVLPELVQEIEQRQLLRRRLLRQRPQDALRPAGRARRIEHRGAELFVGDRRRRAGPPSPRRGRRCGRSRLAPSATMQSSTFGQSVSASRATSSLRLRGDQKLRLAVGEDVGELARRQVRVDAGVVEARPLARAAGIRDSGCCSP